MIPEKSNTRHADIIRQTMSNRPNANCPVSGCRTTAPHVDDATVKALMIAFAPLAEMTKWTLAAMAELAESICRDLENKKVFAFHTRVRQPEELYIRTLYTLFVASDEEIPHILSGAKTYCHYLNYMHEMFKAGKRREDVLVGVKNLHRPRQATNPDP
jgi:hypothetical protein